MKTNSITVTIMLSDSKCSNEEKEHNLLQWINFSKRWNTTNKLKLPQLVANQLQLFTLGQVILLATSPLKIIGS